VGGESIRAVAGRVASAPSTISREIARNGWLAIELLKPTRLPGSGHIDPRGALKKELLEHLRRTHGMRRSRHTQKTDVHGKISDAISISERPAGVEDRALPGHWEGDLFFGSGNSQIATLVERQTRYVMLVKVARKDTQTVVNALVRHARKLPQELYKSLTWDRGKELAAHKRFTVATDIQVYFYDPQSPWQRGTNENTNGLLRQYLPKGLDISGYSQTSLDAIGSKIERASEEDSGLQNAGRDVRRMCCVDRLNPPPKASISDCSPRPAKIIGNSGRS